MICHDDMSARSVTRKSLQATFCVFQLGAATVSDSGAETTHKAAHKAAHKVETKNKRLGGELQGRRLWKELAGRPLSQRKTSAKEG